MKTVPVIPISDKHTNKQNKKNKSQARDKEAFKKEFEKACKEIKKMKEYKFSVVFEDTPMLATSYTIQVKGSETYPDALIKLVRLASLDGEIQKIERA